MYSRVVTFVKSLFSYLFWWLRRKDLLSRVLLVWYICTHTYILTCVLQFLIYNFVGFNRIIWFIEFEGSVTPKWRTYLFVTDLCTGPFLNDGNEMSTILTSGLLNIKRVLIDTSLIDHSFTVPFLSLTRRWKL